MDPDVVRQLIRRRIEERSPPTSKGGTSSSERRDAEGRIEVDVIVTTEGVPATNAAKHATRSIPTVFTEAGDLTPADDQPILGIFSACCAAAASGASVRLSPSTTASPIRRMSTWRGNAGGSQTRTQCCARLKPPSARGPTPGRRSSRRRRQRRVLAAVRIPSRRRCRAGTALMSTRTVCRASTALLPHISSGSKAPGGQRDPTLPPKQGQMLHALATRANVTRRIYTPVLSLSLAASEKLSAGLPLQVIVPRPPE